MRVVVICLLGSVSCVHICRRHNDTRLVASVIVEQVRTPFKLATTAFVVHLLVKAVSLLRAYQTVVLVIGVLRMAVILGTMLCALHTKILLRVWRKERCGVVLVGCLVVGEILQLQIWVFIRAIRT